MNAVGGLIDRTRAKLPLAVGKRDDRIVIGDGVEPIDVNRPSKIFEHRRAVIRSLAEGAGGYVVGAFGELRCID